MFPNNPSLRPCRTMLSQSGSVIPRTAVSHSQLSFFLFFFLFAICPTPPDTLCVTDGATAESTRSACKRRVGGCSNTGYLRLGIIAPTQGHFRLRKLCPRGDTTRIVTVRKKLQECRSRTRRENQTFSNRLMNMKIATVRV